MVSLIERSSYIADLKENIKFNQFMSFVSGQMVSETEYEVEIDQLFNKAVVSIAQNNNKSFNNAYSQISERHPNKNSPILHDDLLLFVLIVGTEKFNTDNSWLLNTITYRANSEKESILIKNTFLSIINGNFKNRDNLYQLVIVLETLLDLELISWEEKAEFYNDITAKDITLFKSDFLNIISLRAYDLIIVQGDKSDMGRFYLLNDFEKRFMKRTTFISYIIYFLFVISISVLIIKLWYNPDYTKKIEQVLPIIGAIGLSLLSLFSAKKLIPFFESITRWILGYKKH